MKPYQFNTRLALFSALLLTLGIQNCVKYEPLPPSEPPVYQWQIQYDSLGLPVLTQEGKGVFGFLLNGQAWRPSCSQGSWVGGWGALYSDIAQIATYNKCAPTKQELVIKLPYPIEAKNYLIEDSTHVAMEDLGIDAYFNDLTANGYRSYTSGTISKARSNFNVEFYDPERSIISGRFHIVLYRSIIDNTLRYAPLIERDPYLDLTDSTLSSVMGGLIFSCVTKG